MTRTTHRVTTTREDGWWILEVPDIRGVFSQARRLDQAEAMARDAIAAMLDVAEDGFDVVVEPHLAGLAADDLAEALEARGSVEQAQTRARVATERAAQRLHGEGLPMRDIGRLLGISHQRVARLLTDAEHTSHRAA